MFDWLGDIGNAIKSAIEDTISGWVEEIINWILQVIFGIVFNLPYSSFVNNVITFLTWFTGICAVTLALYKVIEYIINTQNGTQQYPLDEILLRVAKSAGAMLVLPWALKKIFLNIALPMANYFAIAGTDFEGQAGYVAISGALNTGLLAAAGMGGIILIGFLIFFAIVFVMFLFSTCVFYADYVVMQILVAPVSLSMIADDNNYFSVWWRELLSIVTSLLVKLFLVSLIINIIFTGGNIFLAIGAGALIIKTPSVLKNMWYGGGGARAISRGVGSIGAMGSRQLISKMFR